jgi:predicted dehydrogenase
VRLGLVGYGVGGRYFHAPFVVAAEGVELAGVVTRSLARRDELAADLPGVPAYDSLTEMLAAGVDAVTITTPPHTRRALVLEAISAGVPTIADKPFAPDAQGGRELVAAAAEAGVPLNVFHNRRWDADIQTLAGVLESAELGELWGVESRMDQANAATLEIGPDAGLLRDLGSHLVDQMLWLLGPARTVYAELDHVEPAGGRTDCRFALSLTHADGVHSRVSASKINYLEDRELRAYGSGGSYVAHGTDVQAQAVFAGRRPVDEGDKWGYDAPEHWGTLNTATGAAKVPSEQGAYQDYYAQFAAAVRGDGEFPVPAEQAVHTLEVLDAARASAEQNRVLELDPA